MPGTKNSRTLLFITAEMPSLNKHYLVHRYKGLVVLAISIDPSEQNVKSFISQKGYSIPVLIDNKKEVFFETYGLFGLPVSLIIDRDGTIVQKVIGETAWNSPQMEEKIRKLLAGGEMRNKRTFIVTTLLLLLAAGCTSNFLITKDGKSYFFVAGTMRSIRCFANPAT